MSRLPFAQLPQVASSIVPTGSHVAPGVVLPTGWVRATDGRAIDLVGYMRDIVSSMTACSLKGTHSTEMQLAVAAAAFVEIAAVVAPGAAPWARAACFPDEDFDADQVAVDLATPAGARPHPEPTWIPAQVTTAGCFDHDGRTYGCMQAAGKAVYIEPVNLGDSRGVHVWASEVDAITQEARYIGTAWPLPPTSATPSWEAA